MIAIDTNLLVYAHRKDTSEHKAARKAIEYASNSSSGWGIALPCIAEFWMVVTHPSSTGGASTPSAARDFLESLIESGDGVIWSPSSDFWRRFVNAGNENNISGARIFDLQIAMIAYENGAAEIWTHDKKFRSLPGLKVVDPI